MKNCFVFNIEIKNKNLMNNHYDIMTYLLIYSIRYFYKDVDIICTYFGNIKDLKTSKIYNLLINNNIKIYNDNLPFNNIIEDNYYLRNYSLFYLTTKTNILNIYDNLIYLDIDVVLLSKIQHQYFKEDSIIIEEVPKYIKLFFDNKHLPKNIINKKLYYNWFQIINKSNAYIYNIDFNNNCIEKQSDIIISNNINNSNLNIIYNNEAYYPKKELNNNTCLLHYDSFMMEGTLIYLKEYNERLFNKYNSILKIFNIELQNEKKYWVDFKRKYNVK